MKRGHERIALAVVADVTLVAAAIAAAAMAAIAAAVVAIAVAVVKDVAQSRAGKRFSYCANSVVSQFCNFCRATLSSQLLCG